MDHFSNRQSYLHREEQAGNAFQISPESAEKNVFKKILLGMSFVIIFGASISFLWSPPSEFPENKIFEIKHGMTLGEISAFLKEEHVIRSRFAFEFCVISFRGDRGALSGNYLFKEPLGACMVAQRIVKGISGIPAVRITIPEGSSVKEIAQILAKNMPEFDTAHFLTLAEKKEGYLFPDTYFFKGDTSPEKVLETFLENFEKKFNTLTKMIERSGNRNDLVIMASIIEKEARTPKDQEIVSGILWKRIDIKMPLQVDAPFYYLLGKESSEITQKDLYMKSPYNTYRNLGLPIAPISNPGYTALLAAAVPQESPYLFYLSDKEGIIHYAKNFEEHKKNKAKYLK
ncbi:MAG: endolytic transglycosylase MltG [Patescibacteria group bacterium]